MWPPLAISARNGGSSGSGSRKAAATWPWRWSTGISGLPVAAASDFAVLTPTSSAPISPGLAVTAIASISSRVAAGVVERRVDHRVDQLEVAARGDLGDDAAEAGVQLGLRGDDVAEHARAVEDGGAGVVAGGLDREDPASSRHALEARARRAT